MKLDWTLQKISDIASVNANSYSTKENWPFVDYLDTGNITENVIDSIQHIDVKTEKLPSRARRKVTYNSIIYSTVRPNQRHFGIMKNVSNYLLVSTGFAVIDVNPLLVDADFLYFYLSQPDVVEHLHSIAEQSVSAYPSIKASDIENLVIQLPPLHVQCNISAALQALDDKIALNSRINDNLLQQARTLFKAWFVDFLPFGNVKPQKWVMSALCDISTVGAGGDKPTAVSMQRTEEFPYPIYSNGIMQDGLYGYASKAKIYDESVTVSARGTIGFVRLRYIPYVPIVRLVYLIPNAAIISAKYLYLWLENTRIAGTGTTQQQLTVPDFQKTEILIPDFNMMKQFTDIVTPLFEKIWKNQEENENLSAIRDTLLPRLMSGELDVSDMEL